MADADRPSFRPERAESRPPGVGLLVALVIALAIALLGRSWWEPAAPRGELVEVVGEVPAPGAYLLPNATIHEALRAAGAEPSGPDGPVPPGHRVVASGGSGRVEPSGDPLLVGLPIDVNVATVDVLASIPGVGRGVAVAIVDERAHGPYVSVDDLSRARGVGSAQVDLLRPFVTVGVVTAPGPLDLNVATAAELERLPGIGAVTAARIVMERDERGPFRDLDDLGRVQGVGHATIEGLRGLAIASPGAP